MTGHTNKTMGLIRRLLQAPFLAAFAFALLFEEWGWAPLQAALAQLARLPLLRQLEAWIEQLPPWSALAMFALPAIALLPIKLAALVLFGAGRAAAGLALLFVAKLAGTALVARLFVLTRPALMQLPWFARWYPRWKRWKDELIGRIHDSGPWRAARRFRLALRARISAWWSAS